MRIHINNLGFRRYIFYAEKYLPKSKMKLGEGEDFSWVRLEDAFGLDLTERARQDLLMFQKQIAQ